MSLILGIDPGLQGAMALVNTHSHRVEEVWDMPVLHVRGGRGALDLHRLHRMFQEANSGVFQEVDLAVLEEVSAMPRQGVTSSFTFGRVSMAPEAFLVAENIRYQTVRPAVWKRAMRVVADKDSSRQMAARTFPQDADLFSRAKDDGRAEAALLALFGMRFL